MTTPTPIEVQTEREAFDAWADSKSLAEVHWGREVLWMAWQASAAHAVEKAEPAHSWRADVGGASVYNDDFTTDVRLNISGDFEDSAERKAYADALAAKLNAASQAEKAEPVAPADVWQLVSDAEVARFTAEGIQRLKIAAPAYIKIWQP